MSNIISHDGQEIQGLSKYWIYDDGDEMTVVNRRTGRKVSFREKAVSGRDFLLVLDDNSRRHCTIGFLRYLISNPRMNAIHLNLQKNGIRFLQDGTVTGLYDYERKRMYNVFRNTDDVVETVMFMLEAARGNIAPAYAFCMDAKNNACRTVSVNDALPISKVRRNFCYGVERFLSELKEANVKSIRPLFCWLCKCVQTETIQENKRGIRFDKSRMERVREDETMFL